MCYLHVSCLPSIWSIILPASVCLPICFFIHVTVRASVQLMRGSRNFCYGGSRPENRSDNVFFCFLFVCFFVSPQLILQFLQRVSNGYFKENYNFPRFQRGPTFAWGYYFFQGGGGVQMLIFIETHITCDFPGGSRPLIPLWIRTRN